MYECFHCGAKAVIWDADFTLEEYGILEGGRYMTIEQAIKILDPETSDQAITEIEGLRGTDATDYVVSQIKEACRLACKVMKQWERDVNNP